MAQFFVGRLEMNVMPIEFRWHLVREGLAMYVGDNILGGQICIIDTRPCPAPCGEKDKDTVFTPLWFVIGFFLFNYILLFFSPYNSFLK